MNLNRSLKTDSLHKYMSTVRIDFQQTQLQFLESANIWFDLLPRNTVHPTPCKSLNLLFRLSD